MPGSLKVLFLKVYEVEPPRPRAQSKRGFPFFFSLVLIFFISFVNLQVCPSARMPSSAIANCKRSPSLEAKRWDGIIKKES